MWQFSATWPTVKLRTSNGLPGSLLAAEAAVVEEAVDRVAHRDIDGEHQRRERNRGPGRLLEEKQQETEEDDGADRRAVGRAAPARHSNGALRRRAGAPLLLALRHLRAGLGFRLGAASGTGAAGGVDRTALGPAVLATASFLRLSHANGDANWRGAAL